MLNFLFLSHYIFFNVYNKTNDYYFYIQHLFIENSTNEKINFL